ncbi:MAG: porin family protein [Muribaculaceae bacterium]|nr:porin family protein [Muribaculaceae bacterium]
MKNYFRLLASLLVLSFTMPVFANDNNDEENRDRASFGVRAMFDLTNSRTVSEITDWGAGGTAGISYYVPFGKLTYFNPGLMIGCETVRLDGYAGSEKTPLYFTGNMMTLGMRLPLDIGLKLFQFPDVRVSVYTGPHIFINFAVKGKYNMEDPETHIVYIHHDRNLDEFKGFELDWGVGIAVDIKRHWQVMIESNIGLTQFAEMEKVYPGETSRFKRRAFSVGIGYRF